VPGADREQIEIGSRAELRAWLEVHHEKRDGVWIIVCNASDPDRHLPHTEVVDEALCFGWIDSQGRKLDAVRRIQLLTPRRKGSRWSRINKGKVARLEAEGRMAPAGLAAVERARADGSWTALDEVEDLIEPPDLKAALDAVPEARRHWDAFPRTPKRANLERLLSVKRPETRERRIREIVENAAVNERTGEWRPKPRAG
jgi:uncharacterized protein YdeI (YjbR/CyaY-like superfamily)